MTATNFPKALKLVLIHEGGWTNDPYDPGGATMKGVIQRVYSAYRKLKGLPFQSVRNISEDELLDIYKQQYWNMIRGDELPAGLDYVVFDGAVNSGYRQSVKWLQRALRPHYAGPIDGWIGIGTMGAVRSVSNRSVLIKNICAQRMSFLQSLRHWWRFGKGWSNRVRDVERDALRMLG